MTPTDKLNELNRLRQQSKNLSNAEDILLVRIQKIIRLKGEVDARIDEIERGIR